MGAAGEFKRWIYSDHKIAPGLIPRRDAERRLFLQSGAADIAALLLGAMMAGAAVLVLQSGEAVIADLLLGVMLAFCGGATVLVAMLFMM